MFRMYEDSKARRTLDQKYIPEYWRKVQSAEAIKLEQIIYELAQRNGVPIDIFDIGVGYARVPVYLSKIKKIWKCINQYVGIDNSKPCLREAKINVRKHNISDKVKIIEFDARNLDELLYSDQRYHLVHTDFFTGGTLATPDSYTFIENANVDFLDIKNAFQRIFKPADKLVKPKGKLFLGSAYRNNEFTATKQREFYENCGMTVISRPNDPFTSTKEGFWSLRFSEESIRDLFDWVDPEKIKIEPLVDEFAMMVIVSKD